MSTQQVATVTLRRVTPADAELVHGWRGEVAASRYQPLRQYSLEELRTLLRDRAAAPITPMATGKLQWITLADGEPAGWVNLEIASREHGLAYVGYTITTRLHGRGIASRALIALLPTAFGADRLALAWVEGIAVVDNVASRRVMERAGFRQEGVLRGLMEIDGERVDHAVYGLLRTDWTATRDAQGTSS